MDEIENACVHNLEDPIRLTWLYYHFPLQKNDKVGGKLGKSVKEAEKPEGEFVAQGVFDVVGCDK